MVTNTTSICLSLPNELVNKIDSLKNDIPRSRYVLRLIEEGLKVQEKTGGKK